MPVSDKNAGQIGHQKGLSHLCKMHLRNAQLKLHSEHFLLRSE
jgi:hypothetical protein